MRITRPLGQVNYANIVSKTLKVEMKRVNVKRKIVYVFPGRDGKDLEVPFDVPEGVTSYPEQSLKVSLYAHINLEHNRDPKAPFPLDVWTKDEGEVTYVRGIYKHQVEGLEVRALTFNFISNTNLRFY